jgi:hypothetical protein
MRKMTTAASQSHLPSLIITDDYIIDRAQLEIRFWVNDFRYEVHRRNNYIPSIHSLAVKRTQRATTSQDLRFSADYVRLG